MDAISPADKVDSTSRSVPTPVTPVLSRPIPPEPKGVKLALPAGTFVEIPISDEDLGEATIKLEVWVTRKGGWTVSIKTEPTPEANTVARIHPNDLLNVRPSRKIYAHCVKATTLYYTVIQPEA